MNPLEWKREHQIALLISAGIGFVFGLIFGLHELNTPCWVSMGCIKENVIYWITIVGDGICGAIIAAVIIYTVQLMRR
jgi:hypothetical protein